MRTTTAVLWTAVALAFATPAHGQSSQTVRAIADAALASGAATNPVGADLTHHNFGGAGTLSVAAGASVKGRFDTVIAFDIRPAIAAFDGQFGAGAWALSGLTLTLRGDNATQGAQPGNPLFNATSEGRFEALLLAGQDWIEGTSGGQGGPGYPDTGFVSLASDLASGPAQSLGVLDFVPAGGDGRVDYALSPPADLSAAVNGMISLYLRPADDGIAYMFNAHRSDRDTPALTLVAAPK